MEARYQNGTLEESGSWRDYQRLDHLEFERDRLCDPVNWRFEMRYTVMLRKHATGKYIAMAPAVPDCRVEGRTRHEAMEHLRLTLEEWFRGTEMTSIEVSAPSTDQGVPGNPWLDTAGLFADDLTLEPLLQEIYAERNVEGLVR